MESSNLNYIGFWPRVGASLIDLAILGVLTAPILTFHYGESYWVREEFGLAGPLDFILSYAFPALAVILFWSVKQATPGKMAIHAKIADARTGQAPSTAQCIGRYFAYIPATLPLGLGIIWVAFDPRKQGWHDKLAGTVVVAPKVIIAKEVSFDEN